MSRRILLQVADGIRNPTKNQVILKNKEINKLLEMGFTSTTNSSPPDHSDEIKEQCNYQQRNDKRNLTTKKSQEAQLLEQAEKNKGETEEKIRLRTIIIINSIKEVSSPEGLMKRFKHLEEHVKKYPEAAKCCRKEEIQDVLINIRKTSAEKDVIQILNEFLSLIGYSEPPPLSGIRVLSIDGGGMRGLVSIKILQELVKLSGKRIYQLFDYICGVSTGAFITCCSVPPIALDLERLRDLYIELGRQIFKQSTLKGAGKLLFNCAYYETSIWEKALREQVGSITLLETIRHSDCPKFSVLSTVGTDLNVVPFIFRNYSLPNQKSCGYPGSCYHTLFEALRASGAAPTVFEEFRTADYTHIDGGIAANNPSGVAIHEVKGLWPNSKLNCLVSCGNGKQVIESKRSQNSSSWRRILDKVLVSATNTESVHMILNDLLDDNVYYRFNPILSSSFGLDEVDENKILRLESDVLKYCSENSDKLNAVVKKLTEPLIKNKPDQTIQENKQTSNLK